jgi:hypothetical protein
VVLIDDLPSELYEGVVCGCVVLIDDLPSELYEGVVCGVGGTD